MTDQPNPRLPGYRSGPLMDTPTMLLFIKSGGRAKRLHWEWAYLAWNERIGPHRGDMEVRHGGFSAADWLATDWTARP